MRRIYIEAFAGLLLLFTLSLTAYEILVYQINTDYDYILEDLEGAAFREVLMSISESQGEKEALTVLRDFINQTAKTLSVYPISKAPTEVRKYFSGDRTHLYTYYDDEREFWFMLSSPDIIYRVKPDVESSLRKAIAFDDDLLWGFILGGFFIYTSGLIWFLSRRVRVLEEATVKFAQGDFNSRAPTGSRYRVGSLNDSFNYMADKISDLITSNRSLTNSIAHDLRTPIFRIQWQAEMLQDEELTQAQHDKIASIIEDTEEMEQMADELLYFAKVERPDSILNIESIELQSYLTDLVSKLPSNHGNLVEVDVSDSIVITGDSALIKRAIGNLLSNALRYVERKIRLSAQQDLNDILIFVEDDGPGIPVEHWNVIFDPFYSADPSRNKSSTGFGLGLAIVKLIIDRHGGEIHVGVSSLGGAKFTLRIPHLSASPDKS
ncbi:two-component sensor histidine kinase [Vibrio zhanjiangensis]|uniref:histidine kinase n=1 Tax=Vibrio zhanjiangensis TaxID=1046128 RepID=A0ABQ6F351_9VIBR|nr:ATP-binding protein [Vibrio zhanjiangensis]GLT19399.1 two-component sensor histidine kinase [Vibrio zhanjiangensis]